MKKDVGLGVVPGDKRGDANQVAVRVELASLSKRNLLLNVGRILSIMRNFRAPAGRMEGETIANGGTHGDS